MFTLPGALGPLARRNPRVVYGLLMRAAAATLLEVAADPKHLGAEVGVLAVLHTWGQSLTLHPHVHCVVTGGGLSPDGEPLGRRPRPTSSCRSASSAACSGASSWPGSGPPSSGGGSASRAGWRRWPGPGGSTA